MISMCWFWAVAGLAEKAANASTRPVTPAAHRNDFAVLVMTRSRDRVVERGEYRPTGAFAACVTNAAGGIRSAHAGRAAVRSPRDFATLCPASRPRKIAAVTAA